MSHVSRLSRATLWGTFWSYASFYSGKIMVFVSTIILARLLSEEDFGVAGYALVVISFLQVMSDLGTGQAVIYHRDHPDAPDTGFWLSIGLGALLFILTWAVAPLVGMFFHNPRAIPVTRVLGVIFPITAIGNMHDVLLRRDLSFGRKFIPDFATAFSKGLGSIGLAFAGLGAWSLIWGQVIGRITGAITLWRIYPWRPRLRFNPGLARALLSYGINLMVVSALGMLIANADYLLIGRYMDAAALGIYTLAFRLPDLLVMQFCYIIGRVIFPVYATLRSEPDALCKGFINTARYVSLITVPLGLGMMLIARPLVLTFFTSKWEAAIEPMRSIAIYALALSLAYNVGDVYKAQGRPQILTYISLGRLAILLPGLWWAVTRMQSIAAVGWTHAVIAILTGIFELSLASRLLHTPLREIIAAILPALTAGAFMSLATQSALLLSAALSPWLQLTLSVLVGGAAYLGILWFTQHQLISDAFGLLVAAARR
ncbi:MAG: lipopolysaccharide biosynthesis protein [Anaerolineales bacterium]